MKQIINTPLNSIYDNWSTNTTAQSGESIRIAILNKFRELDDTTYELNETTERLTERTGDINTITTVLTEKTNDLTERTDALVQTTNMLIEKTNNVAENKLVTYSEYLLISPKKIQYYYVAKTEDDKQRGNIWRVYLKNKPLFEFDEDGNLASVFPTVFPFAFVSK